MTLLEWVLGGGGLTILLLSLVQFAPVKWNPLTWLAKWFGKQANGELMEKVSATQKALEAHIRTDDERNADAHRASILRFNNECVRGIPHTQEEFTEILGNIDAYERYCTEHPEYRNNRAVHAIANIGRVYDDRLKQNDFIQ